MREHGRLGQASCSTGELKVADQVREDLPLHVMQTFHADLEPLRKQLFVCLVTLAISPEDYYFGSLGLHLEFG